LIVLTCESTAENIVAMSELSDNVLDASQLEAFRRESAVRSGLPGIAYANDSFLRLENERLFPNNWTFVGFAHEIKNAGDVFPTTLGGRPILLVRTRSGDIKVFHNVCRHRCLKLVDAPGNVGQHIQCPYHTWTYSLEGDLKATPHFGGYGKHHAQDFKLEEHGLVPIRSVVWGDWIFVNLNNNAGDFVDYATPLIARLEGVDVDNLVPLARLDFGEVATNWKFLMENFMEPYHVQYVHPTTTEQPLGDHRTIVDGVCLGSLVDLPDDQVAVGSLAVSSRYLTLFPNFVIGRYFPDQLGVYLNIPISAGKTRQIRMIYSTGEREFSKAEVEDVRNLWYSVHKEDHAMCERLQAGRESQLAAEGGFLSPVWEDSIRRYQELIIEAVA